MGARTQRIGRDSQPSILPSRWVTRVETRGGRRVHGGFVGWGRVVDRRKEEEGMNTGEVEEAEDAKEDNEQHHCHYHCHLLLSWAHRTTTADDQCTAPPMIASPRPIR